MSRARTPAILLSTLFGTTHPACRAPFTVLFRSTQISYIVALGSAKDQNEPATFIMCFPFLIPAPHQTSAWGSCLSRCATSQRAAVAPYRLPRNCGDAVGDAVTRRQRT